MSLSTTESSSFKKTKALYERTYSEKGLGVYAAQDWARLQTAERLATGDSVLDIGPGNGALLQILANSEQFEKICGSDIHRHSQLILPENAEYRLQSVAELDFSDKSYDTVFCMEVLEHLEDKDVSPALVHLRRVAKTRLVMTVPYHEPHPLWWHDKPGGHRQQFTAERLVSTFPNAQALFQKRQGVDWIFLIEGEPYPGLPSVQELLRNDLVGVAEVSAPKKVPQESLPATSTPVSNTSIDKNHDRILDVYFGRHGSDEDQEHSRDRIHWILSQVTGQRVLDVGCSQGLVPILLARSGISVVGIDLLPDAIVHAKQALSEEAESVQGLCEFRQADASSLTSESGFDTVILGEVIEHHGSPAGLLSSIARTLKPGGRLVLTTPFGFHPDPDHKQTFFLSEMFDLLKSEFGNIELDVMHHFICCTCSRLPLEGASSENKPLSERQLLTRSERAFLDIQKQLRKDLKTVRYMNSQLARLKPSGALLQQLQTQLEILRGVSGAGFESLFFSEEEQTSRLSPKLKQFLTQPMPNQSVGDMMEIVPFLYGKMTNRLPKIFREANENRQSQRELRAHKATLKFRKKHPRGAISSLVDSLANRLGPTKQKQTSAAKKSSDVSIVRPRLELPIACILDEFSWENFRYECDLYQITKEDWKAELTKKRPEFLFVESAWAGNNGNWKYKITYSEPKEDNPLFALLAYCQEEGIPTVFWNKEDPPNYDYFLNAACRFDYIFTTDSDCVERYKKAAPNSQVQVLPFAAQPATQNPARKSQQAPSGDICFAGAWYPRHPERFEDLKILLEASTDYDLHIYDRYLNHPEHEKYLFPDEYQPFIKGSLGFQEMTKKYSEYRIFLNVNSVKESPTMFSRRVFEILACGTPVVSGYAQGIADVLGQDVVPLVRTADEARGWISKLMESEIERDKLVLVAQRRIFSKHTYQHRFSSICEALAIPVTRPTKRVSVITATIRRDFIDNALQNFDRQSYGEKELLVVLNLNKDLTKEYVEERVTALGVYNVRVIVVPEQTTLGACLNIGVAESNGDIFAKMDDDDYYGAAYLEDSVLALEYSGAECVGKESYFTYSEGRNELYLQGAGLQHRNTKFTIGTTLVGYRSLFPEVSFGNTRVGEDSAFLRRLERAGKTIYSHSQYNYIKFYAKNLSHHTWQIDEESYLKNAKRVTDGYAKELVCF